MPGRMRELVGASLKRVSSLMPYLGGDQHAIAGALASVPVPGHQTRTFVSDRRRSRSRGLPIDVNPTGKIAGRIPRRRSGQTQLRLQMRLNRMVAEIRW